MANYDPKRPRRNQAPSGLPGDPLPGDAPIANVSGDDGEGRAADEPRPVGEPQLVGSADREPDGQSGNGQAAAEQPDGDDGTGNGQPHGNGDITDQQAAAAGTTTPPIDPDPPPGPATHLLPRSPLPDRAVARATIAGAAAAFAFMFICWRLRRCWLHRRAVRLARRSTSTPLAA